MNGQKGLKRSATAGLKRRGPMQGQIGGAAIGAFGS